MKKLLQKHGVLFLDSHVLLVNKPNGVLSMPGSVLKPTRVQRNSLDSCKGLLKEIYDKKGNVFLGNVNRVDGPCSGILCFARNSKSAKRLSEQFRERKVSKRYICAVEGIPKQKHGVFQENEDHSLSYTLLNCNEFELRGQSLLCVRTKTGYKHQIRKQLSRMGLPIVGDLTYGAKTNLGKRSGAKVMLHAFSMSLCHPATVTDTFKFPVYIDNTSVSMTTMDKHCKLEVFAPLPRLFSPKSSTRQDIENQAKNIDYIVKSET